MRASAALFCVLIAFAAQAATAQTLIYRVDQATAVIDGQRLIVTAKGAVRSGGWRNARLIVRKVPATELHDIEIAFVATPPRNHSVVVHSVMPMTVRLRIRLPHYGVAAVRIVSETNTVTAEIIPKIEAQRTAGR